MDRISGLKKDQLIMELLQYKTKKQIKKLTTITELRDELRRLEKKYEQVKIKSPKGRFINKNGQSYKNYIKAGYQEVDNQLVFIRPLPQDTLFNILLNADSKELFNLCYINKSTNDICNNKHFWEMKFKQDDVPMLTKKVNKTSNDWIRMYQSNHFFKNKGLIAKNIKKLKNKIIDTGMYEKEFNTYIEFYYWLDPSIVDDFYLINDIIDYTGLDLTSLLKLLLKLGANATKILTDMILYLNKDLESDLEEYTDYKPEEIEQYYDEKMILLFNQKINLNQQDKEGNTVFHLIMDKITIRYLSLFLEHGADPNIKNNKGETPFIIFCKNAYRLDKDKIKDYLYLLNQYHTDFKVKDNSGHYGSYYTSNCDIHNLLNKLKC